MPRHSSFLPFVAVMVVMGQNPIAAQTDTFNQTSEEESSMEGKFKEQFKIMIIYMSTTIGLALFGNLFLSGAILKRAKGQNKSLNPVQIIILHTCLADILFALITIFPKLCTIITFPYFYGGNVVCKLVMYLQIVPMWASPFLLVAMSADRYQAICNTWTSLRRDKRRVANTLAGIAWGLSLLAPTPQLLIFNFVPHGNSTLGTCYAHFPKPWHGKLYMVWFSLGAWLLPSLASAYFYVHVCWQVRQSMSCVKTSIATPELRGKEKTSINLTGQRYVERLRDSGNRRRLALLVEQQRGKTVKLTLTIVVCNFLLWAPFCITNIIHIFDSALLDPVISTYIMLVGNLNSCVNPWIYLFFNRSQVISFICCRGNDDRKRASTRLSYHSSTRRNTQDSSNNQHTTRSRKPLLRTPSVTESAS